MKLPVIGSMAAPAVAVALALAIGPVQAQQPDNSNAPLIPFVSVPNYLKYSPDMNLGEVLGVAENSKGHPRRAQPSGYGHIRSALRQCHLPAPGV